MMIVDSYDRVRNVGVMSFVFLYYSLYCCIYLFFFFNDTAPTETYTLHIVGSVRCV